MDGRKYITGVTNSGGSCSASDDNSAKKISDLNAAQHHAEPSKPFLN